MHPQSFSSSTWSRVCEFEAWVEKALKASTMHRTRRSKQVLPLICACACTRQICAPWSLRKPLDHFEYGFFALLENVHIESYLLNFRLAQQISY